MGFRAILSKLLAEKEETYQEELDYLETIVRTTSYCLALGDRILEKLDDPYLRVSIKDCTKALKRDYVKMARYRDSMGNTLRKGLKMVKNDMVDSTAQYVNIAYGAFENLREEYGIIFEGNLSLHQKASVASVQHPASGSALEGRSPLVPA
ncbi:hypothetical protein KW787_02510 [Candidatus Pacearchaeota archaeon]|nr:hypothetical protein [Candidatus Pacearchaeota archaeon]